jgi:GGDEF domain-containing protein
VQAKMDRDALLQQLTFVETEQLTGTRTAGFADLEREIDRACRMSGVIVTAYEDVVCLEPVDKIYGDAAGDDLPQDAAPAIRDHLRSYDLVVRVVAMEHPGFGSRGHQMDDA